MKGSVTDYTLYAKRYIIAYSFLGALIVGLFIIAGIYVPGALRQGEVDSALTSGALSIESINPESVINLPYYLLQRLSFMFFGVSTLSIKLPSIVLGALTVLGIFALTRTWFRRNIAVITTAIAVSTAQFLFLLQDGTPYILLPFITVWLLVASTLITRAKYFSTFWKVVGCVLMAAALYAPLGIYVVIALVVTASAHPHIRYVIRRVSRTRLIIALLLGLASVAPLIYAVALKPSVALALLGIPSDGINLVQSVPLALKTLFGFFSPSVTYLVQPLYSLGLAIIMGVGIYKLITVKHTARSYTILILSVFLLVFTLIDPSHALSLYPVAIVIAAMGLDSLISDWYKLFPLNPYARIAGLVPISLFVVGLIFTDSMRFVYNYTYNPDLMSFYSSDLRKLKRTLASTQGTIVVAPSVAERPFYTLVARYDKRFTVGEYSDTAAQTVIVTRAAYTTNLPSREPASILTNTRANNADRFYIYKNSAQ
jgi:4-amino-4-deoxy-L-arabinose transferase-like glycosyltransferase